MITGHPRADKALRDAISGVNEPHRQLSKTLPRPLASEISPPLANEEIFVEKILNATESLLLVLDPAGRVLHFSSACERLSGYPAIKILGQPIWEVLTPSSEIKQTQSRFADLVRDGPTGNLESHWRTSDGKLRRIRWEQVCLRDVNGGVAYVIGLGTDITGRKANEASLKCELTLMQTLMENLPNQIYFKDRQSRFIRVNQAQAHRLGENSPDNLLGKTDFDYFTEEHARQALADEQKIIATGVAHTVEEKETRLGQPDAWVLTTKLPLRDIDQNIIGTFGISVDITERKTSEALLKRELTLMQTLMENLPNQIYFKDRESRFIQVNQALARRLGENDPADLLGKTDSDYFSEEHAQQAFADEQSIIATGQPLRIEEKETRPGLPDTWVLTNKVPLRDDDRNIIGTFGISVDITERKAAEQEMQLRARLFADLAEFAATINAIHEPRLLADALVKAMSKVIPSSIVVITLLDRKNEQYYVRSVCGLPVEAIGSIIEVGEGTTGRAISEKTMVFAEPNSPEQFGSALRPYIPHKSFHTVGIPLLHEGAVLGVISVARADPKTSFTSLEGEILALLGAHVALALANAYLSEEVSALAIHDGLTGLYNRRHFDAALELALARSKRGITSKTLSAIMFDLDHFGNFNEKYGHLGGDALLRHFAGLLEARLRAADIVARYGGEEFVAILEDCPLDNAVRLAEGVRRDLEESFVVDARGRKMRATVSAGCAKLDPRDPSLEALIGAADQALYTAKRTGRNRVAAEQAG